MIVMKLLHYLSWPCEKTIIHHSHMIILIILEIYLLTSNWSQPITGQNVYKQ